MKKKLFALLCIVLFTLSGCNQQANDNNNSVSDNDTPKSDSQTQELLDTATPSTSAEETPKIDITSLTAEEIINYFTTAGFPIEKVIVYTEETDVNELLGRPKQYTSKINFADKRIDQYDIENDPLGGTIEVFNNSSDAESRKAYIEGVQSDFPNLIQYIYIYENILLRIDNGLTPTQASEYENAFNSLCEGNEITYTGDATSSESMTQESQNESTYEITYQNNFFYVDSIGTIWSRAIVEITNTSNHDLFLNNGSYELYAEDGTLIHTANDIFLPFPKIISPGEKGYYYDSTMMDAGTPTEGISITPHVNAASSKLENIYFEVSDTNLYDKENGGFDLHGTFKNTSGEEQTMVYIAAILFDSNQQPLGLIWTIQNNVSADAQMGFELESYGLPDDITIASISNYDVFVFPDQYQY